MQPSERRRTALVDITLSCGHTVQVTAATAPAAPPGHLFISYDAGPTYYYLTPSPCPQCGAIPTTPLPDVRFSRGQPPVV